MIDPKTDEIKGERLWGQAGLSKTQLMPTIFYLHRYLLLGITGKTISGITACAFLIMAITGLILWFPRAEFSALRAAFRIHYAGSMARLQVSAHRVLGFFAAPVLIVLAFSGLYFNQPDWTLPVVKRVMTVSKNDKVTNYPVSKEAAMLTVAEAMQSAQDRYPTARLSRIVLPKKTAIRMRFVRGNPPRFKKMMAQRGSRSTHIADRSCRYVILYGVPLEMCF